MRLAGAGAGPSRPWHGGRAAVPLRIAACAMLALALWPAMVRAQSTADGAASHAGVLTKVVAGIVSYTRWPATSPSIRLCTIGRGPGVEALQRSPAIGSPDRAVAIVPLADLDAAANGCDAVYLGRPTAALARQAVRQFAGRPVLVLGEGAEFCSDGGMFCLEPSASTPRFGVNLDAVARSGLKVNPQVLRIARSGEGPGS